MLLPLAFLHQMIYSLALGPESQPGHVAVTSVPVISSSRSSRLGYLVAFKDKIKDKLWADYLSV